MTNARLAGANVDGADFTNANLNGVDLSGVVNLDGAIGLENPAFSNPAPAAPANQPTK